MGEDLTPEPTIPILKLPTRIEEITYKGQTFYLKRDDLIDPDFSGNKARKLYYYLIYDFPKIKKLISYGSNQSNAMYSMSVLAKIKGWEYEYFVNHIPDYLRENPQGNYGEALKNGMKMSAGQFEPDKNNESILSIKEGGRQKEAEMGIKILADEITTWQKEQGIERLNVFLPSGTGTTALFLQKNSLFNVYTTPCVGDEEYLRSQFYELESDLSLHPTILNTPKKYHFGKLYRDYYKIWLELRQQTGVEFDLLYDPKGWIVMMANLQIFSEPTLYIHQGGLIGNESMLLRYRRKYPSL
jgi:1-aminocyclopropane-1-carboxylate deaminase/D-cysteine desulfhydrase-like pyridoxal-dependent ACC family enzyme